MIDRGIARHDYLIKDANGNTIGKVTSGTQSPSLNKAIGMGYVEVDKAALDNEIFIEIRNNLIKAKIVKMPFTVSHVQRTRQKCQLTTTHSHSPAPILITWHIHLSCNQ